MEPGDPECCARGIPVHLHSKNRSPIATFSHGERLYRRFPPESDLLMSIAFDNKASSTGRSSLCSPDDMLWRCEAPLGGRYHGWGVLSLPADTFDGQSWKTDQGTSYEIEVRHCPTQCNYPHSDFRLLKDGEETSKIKPGSVKMKIRKGLADRGRVRQEIAPNRV